MSESLEEVGKVVVLVERLLDQVLTARYGGQMIDPVLMATVWQDPDVLAARELFPNLKVEFNKDLPQRTWHDYVEAIERVKNTPITVTVSK